MKYMSVIDMKHHLIMFSVMVIVGICFNPMNILAFRVNDLYLSLTLVYGGLIMASNMIWAHEVVHLLHYGTMNTIVFSVGVCLTIVFAIIIRYQLFIDDKQWLRRMISHHSTALTTSHKINDKTENSKVKQLSQDIIDTQELEIEYMKNQLND